MNYEELLPREFAAEMERLPVAYLPWGALEWHGEHMALGLDALKVHDICKLVAARAGGIVVPPVWCGYSTLAVGPNPMPYTLEFQRSTVMLLLGEYLEQLARAGFRLIVVLAGHYGPAHIAALVEAANSFTIFKNWPQTMVWVLPDYELARDLGYRGDHAAKWETSIFMHLRPELVDMGRLDDSNSKKGIGGEDPRTSATAELGVQVVEAITQRLAARVTRFIQGDMYQ